MQPANLVLDMLLFLKCPNPNKQTKHLNLNILFLLCLRNIDPLIREVSMKHSWFQWGCPLQVNAIVALLAALLVLFAFGIFMSPVIAKFSAFTLLQSISAEKRSGSDILVLLHPTFVDP